MLEPQYEASGARHFREAITRAKGQGTVPTSDIDKARGENSTHFRQCSLMLVAYERRQLFTERLDLAMVASIALLHVDHRRTQ
jgi:hypothetical protein